MGDSSLSRNKLYKVTLSIILAYQNNTGYPQIVKPTNSNAGKSMRVYFDNVEIEL